MAGLMIEEVDGGVAFTAKIVPAGSQTCLCGLLGGMLKIKVSAPPEKGKANKCLLEFLAKKLGVKKTGVSIISGRNSKVKSVQVLGISAQTLREKLNLNGQGHS
jgi:uncharacterized protein (TIGR00251 family)